MNRYYFMRSSCHVTNNFAIPIRILVMAHTAGLRGPPLHEEFPTAVTTANKLQRTGCSYSVSSQSCLCAVVNIQNTVIILCATSFNIALTERVIWR